MSVYDVNHREIERETKKWLIERLMEDGYVIKVSGQKRDNGLYPTDAGRAFFMARKSTTEFFYHNGCK